MQMVLKRKFQFDMDFCAEAQKVAGRCFHVEVCSRKYIKYSACLSPSPFPYKLKWMNRKLIVKLFDDTYYYYYSFKACHRDDTLQGCRILSRKIQTPRYLTDNNNNNYSMSAHYSYSIALFFTFTSITRCVFLFIADYFYLLFSQKKWSHSLVPAIQELESSEKSLATLCHSGQFYSLLQATDFTLLFFDLHSFVHTHTWSLSQIFQ